MGASGPPVGAEIDDPDTGSRHLPATQPTRPPWVGLVKPFLMPSSSQFRTDGPLALDSPAYAAEFNEVKALGSADPPPPGRRTRRTSLVGGRARPTGVERCRPRPHRTERLRRRRQRPSLRDAEPERGGRGDQLLERQVPLGLLEAGERDPLAADDGNPATEPDPDWTALINAPYPDHPSGHLCLDGAHTQRAEDVLRRRDRGGLPDHERVDLPSSE